MDDDDYDPIMRRRRRRRHDGDAVRRLAAVLPLAAWCLALLVTGCGLVAFSVGILRKSEYMNLPTVTFGACIVVMLYVFARSAEKIGGLVEDDTH